MTFTMNTFQADDCPRLKELEFTLARLEFMIEE